MKQKSKNQKRNSNKREIKLNFKINKQTNKVQDKSIFLIKIISKIKYKMQLNLIQIMIKFLKPI